MLSDPDVSHYSKQEAYSESQSSEVLKDACTKSQVLKIIGEELAKEIKEIASDRVQSILQSQTSNDVKNFKWDTLLNEMSRYTPTLKMLLAFATKTRKPRCNTKAVICMCAAIIISHRNSRMNFVQKIVSLILYCGHTSKKVRCGCDVLAITNAQITYIMQVYGRLQRLNVAVSHSSVIRLLDKVGKGFDSKVLEWRDSLISFLDDSNEIVSRLSY